jgi:hypothetical protein
MKVIHELIAYFQRQGKIKPKQLDKLLQQGFLASDAPASMTSLGDRIGETFYFRITGDANGTVWGTGTYTGDSALGAAAVHAGAVKLGESGVARVTVVEPLQHYKGSTKNGITTHEYGPYGTAYKVEPV